mgnify:CR=1 FL=1|jgi:hypothetical protein
MLQYDLCLLCGSESLDALPELISSVLYLRHAQPCRSIAVVVAVLRNPNSWLE